MADYHAVTRLKRRKRVLLRPFDGLDEEKVLLEGV
jgi:hypothetical protein